MAYLTALLIIDAPASALNNSGDPIQNARTENTVSVKFINRGGRQYPYVSAQAYRRWLRDTLDKDSEWQMSPIYREDKVAYTDANPVKFWDDDLLGYMRAPSKKAKGEEIKFVTEMGDGGVVTRMSPLRVSTLVSIAPVRITTDFGVMARQEGDPAPYEHQFYSATLQGLLSLNLGAAGTFTYSRRTGYQNLDSVRKAQAEKVEGVTHLPDQLAYQLPVNERINRLQHLINALPLVQGGAKQTLHYTDVSPVVVIAAITKNGNHPFNYLFSENAGGVSFKAEEFIRVVNAAPDQFLSPVCVGWKPGYLPEEAAKLNDINDQLPSQLGFYYATPIEVFRQLAAALPQSPAWLA